ncbi:MAG: hypothetical protein KDK66_07050 [Deltaproteobacteria bacterium]|nr:hypothetical protein [Deltaproteobacteria bacterium]
MKLKIGSVPYLNAKPLLYGLEENPDFQLHLAPPAQLVPQVFKGSLDLALLPVVALLEHPELKLIPGTGIASQGEVQSVRVFFKHQYSNLLNCHTFCLDKDSQTSSWLLKVLLKKKYNRDLEEIQWVEDPNQAEACLLIGDPALKQWHEGQVSLDLSQEWHNYTGLPFVFAAWMSSQDLSPSILQILSQAKQSGKNAIPSIAQKQKILPPDLVLDYLSHAIHYDLKSAELLGLKLFLEWVEELGEKNYDTRLRFVA